MKAVGVVYTPFPATTAWVVTSSEISVMVSGPVWMELTR